MISCDCWTQNTFSCCYKLSYNGRSKFFFSYRIIQLCYDYQILTCMHLFCTDRKIEKELWIWKLRDEGEECRQGGRYCFMRLYAVLKREKSMSCSLPLFHWTWDTRILSANIPVLIWILLHNEAVSSSVDVCSFHLSGTYYFIYTIWKKEDNVFQQSQVVAGRE